MRYLAFQSLALPLLVIGIISSCSRNDGKIKSTIDIDKYQFINEIFNDTSQLKLIRNDIRVIADINTTPTPIYNGTEIQYISENLSESDTLFLLSQIADRKLFKADNLQDYGFKILKLSELQDAKLSSDSLWNYVNANYGSGYFALSMPIFNKNLDLALIRISYSCGYYCGGGGTFVFVRQGGRWKLKTTLNGWES